MLGNFFRGPSDQKQRVISWRAVVVPDSQHCGTPQRTGRKTLKLTVLPQAETMEIKEIT
jgi:hypothetical protein